MDLPFGVSKAKAFDLKTIVAADLLSTHTRNSRTYGRCSSRHTTIWHTLGLWWPTFCLFCHQSKLQKHPWTHHWESKDQDGAPALRMALQTREQHIKRDRALQISVLLKVLLVMARMYAVYHGPKGLKNCQKNTFKRRQTRKKLVSLGLTQLNQYCLTP